MAPKAATTDPEVERAFHCRGDHRSCRYSSSVLLRHLRHGRQHHLPCVRDLRLNANWFVLRLPIPFVDREAFVQHTNLEQGNTIFLGLGGATPHSTSKPYGWAKSLTSICCFCLGCSLFSHASRILGPLRRGTLVLEFLLQSSIIMLAAAVIQARVVNGDLASITNDIDWHSALPIALLSFQASGQIVASRALSLSEIPTVVVTSMLHDISTDPRLLSPPRANVKRNRRLLAFFGILVGAVVGGFIAEATGKVQVPLWVAGAIKVVITVAWMLWPIEQTSGV